MPSEIVKLRNRIAELESALRIIHTWASYEVSNVGAIAPLAEYIRDICKKVLKKEGETDVIR